jgi:hypothetical protein
MILVGIDDTDILGARGTNKLARALARLVGDDWRCARILRHQLLVDPRIPFTSHNGSASLAFEPRGGAGAADLGDAIRSGMLSDFIPGSDPGLCVAPEVPRAVVDFAERCRREVVTAEEARDVARRHGLRLEGLGGTEGGVIGALAAVGLAATGDHGRVVFDPRWTGEEPSGDLPVAAILARGVDAVLDEATGREIGSGTVAVAKKLRPNRRGGRTVLLVEASGPGLWRALRRD